MYSILPLMPDKTLQTFLQTTTSVSSSRETLEGPFVHRLPAEPVFPTAFYI